MTLKQLSKRIEACRCRLEKERDILRGLENKAAELADDCDPAIHHLERAADELSKFF